MADEDSKQPILIRKRRKGHGGHAHHGGAWKVAYADFVTAMMAFFLLLWLLASASEEQKQGIADYFSPVSVSRNSQSGSGGLLGGETITVDGAMVSNRTPFGVTMTLPADDSRTSEMTDEPVDGEETPASEDYADSDERAVDDEGLLAELAPGERERGATDGRDAGAGPDGEQTDISGVSQAELARLAERQAEAEFEEAVEQLRAAIQSVPELAGLADNLLVDRTTEGMRLQIVDQEGTSMFERGSAVPAETTRRLFSMISQTLAKLPNRIAIKGHTDAVPYRGDGGYTNWELSSDRALASRRALVEAGLAPGRVADVVGKAETDPLVSDNPTAPQNRRISIILLNQPAGAGA
ncbi:MAG: flagellar motor protein MotB, partial [Tistlia sp.]